MTTRDHKPGTWTGDEPLDRNPGHGDVALDWYLSDAERAGLINAIPREPGADSCWCRPECRRMRIEELTHEPTDERGSDRDERLKQLEQAKNFERPVMLEAWWNEKSLGEFVSTKKNHVAGPECCCPEA